MTDSSTEVAIVDCGLGNLFSVRSACGHVGLRASITSDIEQIQTAEAVILPGVGAFQVAMERLRYLGLDRTLREFIESGRPFVGICLGMQLLFSESSEFGDTPGLSITAGRVVPFPSFTKDGHRLKVPQIGWNLLERHGCRARSEWQAGPLAGVSDKDYLYFVHSYYVESAPSEIILSRTRYGDVDYVSSIAMGNVFACQFHPERSGPVGLTVYQNLARTLNRG